jgi:hypothetical protein
MTEHTDEMCTRKTYFYLRPLLCYRPAVATFQPDPKHYPADPPGNLDVRHRLCIEHADEQRARGRWIETTL